MSWAATALSWGRTALVWLRTVPAWVWTVLALALALWALWLKHRAGSKVDLMVEQREAVRRYHSRTKEIRTRREQKLEIVRKKYRDRVDALDEKDAALVKTAGDVDKITDAVNDAFGDPDE